MTEKRKISKAFNEDKYLENKLRKLNKNKKSKYIRDDVNRYLYINNKNEIPVNDIIVYRSSDI
jgi:UTP-glucose-1-phosphate uridylyltransferase